VQELEQKGELVDGDPLNNFFKKIFSQVLLRCVNNMYPEGVIGASTGRGAWGHTHFLLLMMFNHAFHFICDLGCLRDAASRPT